MLIILKTEKWNSQKSLFNLPTKIFFWHHKKAQYLDLIHFQILHQRVLIQIAVLLSENKTELKAIKGIGKRTLERYGDDILDIVANYRNSC